ncbi:hypothetical protein D3OALGA1CA_3600 [Olavius algarvensis associated proteobacterium Delta 3]|nr:hypothetical protein D3OALGB2SA_2273 [Olavius algarvensis associated proteobacterium Delta 3]CAB5136878.1 hypothetical protein D3OALGA1CA_3600 [Olavius algarvensis associated proteobacterium Delta 3]
MKLQILTGILQVAQKMIQMISIVARAIPFHKVPHNSSTFIIPSK